MMTTIKIPKITHKKGSEEYDEWMNHPAMKTIDPVKLELIKTAAAQTSGKKGNSLATVMMALIASANKKGIQFTSEEFP